MDDLLGAFLDETAEHFAVVDHAFDELKVSSEHHESLSEIYRAAHTIKGNCRFLDLPRLEALAHASEDSLGACRDQKIPLSPALLGLLSDAFAIMKDRLRSIDVYGFEASEDNAALIEALHDAGSGKPFQVPKRLPREAHVHPRSEEPQTGLDGLPALVPIGAAFSKLPRLIENLCLSLGKKIKLTVVGDEILVPRKFVDLLRDPVFHIVQNAADHGIERPEERVQRGKVIDGTIGIVATADGDTVVLTVTDDGQGIDPTKIKAKLIEKNLAVEDKLAAMSDHHLLQLVFTAGFSTHDQVTPYSGRGIGLDVVKTNLEKMGGSVNLTSVPGGGSSFRLTFTSSHALPRFSKNSVEGSPR